MAEVLRLNNEGLDGFHVALFKDLVQNITEIN